MYKSKRNNIKLGLFILGGLMLFIFIIYFLGNKRNLFSSTTSVYAIFKNVDGLREGNTIRFAGIDVGVVKSIDIISDTTVRVALEIGGTAQKFIKKDSKISIGSEGLIGNKLVNISSGTAELASIDNGDFLSVSEPLTVDDAINMLIQTGENARNITRDLEKITGMIRDGKGLLGTLVADPALSNSVLRIIQEMNYSTHNFKSVTDDFSTIASNIKNGEGTLGKLVSNDQIADQINTLLDSLQIASHHAVQSTRSLSEFTEKLNKEDGLLGQLASDTALTREIGSLLNNFNEAAKEINVTAEKINNSWLLNIFGGRSNEEANTSEK